jgi:hypothetical protein
MCSIALVVMAKPAVVGQVKTRLIGALTAHQVAAVYSAMLDCVLERVKTHIRSDCIKYVLAIDYSLDNFGCTARGFNRTMAWGFHPVDQGRGDLGDRMGRVWRWLGAGTVLFLGVDSPDVPISVLMTIIPTLNRAEVAVGPVSDGGYWALAASRYQGCLLRDIDWGSPRVYDQTIAAARRAGLRIATLPAWEDTDRPADLVALRERLAWATEPALQRLRARLERICKRDEVR